MVLDDQQKIGVLLTAFGMFFTFLGVLMFFDKGLLAIGNLLFLSGVTVGLGLKKTGKFFFQRRKLRGTTCFIFGIFLVIVGWAFIGLIVEVFGFINLFGDFFPAVIALGQQLPVVGYLFTYISYAYPSASTPKSKSYFDDDDEDFFPIVIAFARRLPIIGNIFNLPVIGTFFDKISSGSSLPI